MWCLPRCHRNISMRSKRVWTNHKGADEMFKTRTNQRCVFQVLIRIFSIRVSIFDFTILLIIGSLTSRCAAACSLHFAATRLSCVSLAHELWTNRMHMNVKKTRHEMWHAFPCLCQDDKGLRIERKVPVQYNERKVPSKRLAKRNILLLFALTAYLTQRARRFSCNFWNIFTWVVRSSLTCC